MMSQLTGEPMEVLFPGRASTTLSTKPATPSKTALVEAEKSDVSKQEEVSHLFTFSPNKSIIVSHDLCTSFVLTYFIVIDKEQRVLGTGFLKN